MNDSIKTASGGRARFILGPVTLLILSAIALFVIFLLPDFISVPSLSPGEMTFVENSNPAPRASFSDKTPLSASEQIRQSKYRSKAQEVLEQTIEIQLQLADRKADIWAPGEYDMAMQAITEGDAAFHARKFELAFERYSESKNLLEALDASIPEKFERLLGKAAELLAENELETAEEALRHALVIQPRHPEVQRLMARTSVRPQVLEQVSRGKAAMQSGDYQTSRQHYRRAVELDEAYAPAVLKLREVEAGIRDSRYNEFMAAGLLALRNEDLQEAGTAFAEAQALKPEDPGVISAINDLNAQERVIKIRKMQQSAERAADEERWQDAVNLYVEILKLDSGILSVQQGSERAKIRQQLDEQINALIADPKQLNDEDRYRNARRLYESVLKIPSPGPRLSAQLSSLHEILRLATIPVRVRFSSDNATSVYIIKLNRNLGVFTQRELDLKPGRYTVRGTRFGYRDVLQNIEIDPGTSSIAVDIRCVERI